MGNGTWFSLSSQKTKLVILQKHRRSSNTLPSLVLQNFPIQMVNSYKFLGLTFDGKLSWIFHIKELKAICFNKILILKYLSHPRTGCNRKLLLQLYRSLIRSQLDYGSPIYSHTCTLNLLKTIQTSSLRLSLGAFRTSPHLSF